ncbi:metallo-beta-lactamase family protein [Oceanicola granulosus HTCC2516]|uniref:Metallo-beta-lactamase family protein n=1 Tax=Oceanicola granulosus (strain ATCC BAA-861 / DSM 15982 / KCTC 12143 / HTCC2516) TaxID=314256 RepID=Q2CGV6_OCEGH|nr:MBL fold metallo-hydrolase [Oceanicola granulosus]EAR51829.1 metallo-beta-lactamase family protein [Oceanicola granulosus HTCC2516]
MPASKQNTQNAGWYRFKVGDLECTTIWDGYIHHGYEGIYPNADPGEMARLKRAYRLPEDYIPMDCNPAVVNDGERLILIDAGMGETSRMFGDKQGRARENLAAAGIDPRDIDAVLMTHLHPDHSFGLIDADGNAAYPNADLYVSEQDWAEWTDEGSLSRNDHVGPWTEGTLAAVKPYRDRLKLFRMGDEVLPGIESMSVAGHSLGQTAFIFESNGEKVVFTGDVAHHQVFDPIHPEWFFHMDYDSDPELGAKAKSDIFARVVDENIRFHGYHFPFPGIGDLERVEDGSYRFHGDAVTPRL